MTTPSKNYEQMASMYLRGCSADARIKRILRQQPSDIDLLNNACIYSDGEAVHVYTRRGLNAEQARLLASQLEALATTVD